MSKALDRNKVVLGLSGGVDSAAAALLLQEKGYEVTGLYFDIWPENRSDNRLSKTDGDTVTGQQRSESATVPYAGRQCAELTAKQLGIDFIYRNVFELFDDIVISNFCSEYACGRTPNPCIVCNPEVKFRTLLEAADEIGAYHIATGHYADTYYDRETNLWYIKRAANEKKDQSYMLYRLEQNAISRLLLPLNEIDDKEKVRQLAREKALDNSEAKDSQEICFIDAEDNYKNYLRRHGITAPEGDFVGSDGTVLGQHKGILDYTIGQRKGLGIALGKPAFVTKIDAEKNQVVLGDNNELFKREVISSCNILLGRFLDDVADKATPTIHNFAVTAKIRYTAKPAEATLQVLEDGCIKTIFKEPQRAATPGQSIVFYDGDLVVGGGFIT